MSAQRTLGAYADEDGADGPRVACNSKRQSVKKEYNEKPLSAFPGCHRTWCEDCADKVDGDPAEVTETVLRGSAGGSGLLHLPREVTR